MEKNMSDASEEIKKLAEKYELPEDFIEDIKRDSKINDLDLRNECRSVVNRNQRYIEEYYKMKRKYIRMQTHVKKVEGELFDKYKNHFEIKFTSSNDVMKFVWKDKRYQKAFNICSDLECIVDYLDRTIKNLNNNAWLVQKLVDLEKINQ
jgi:hypothetical protein